MTTSYDKIATYSTEDEGPRFISAYSPKKRQRITFPDGFGRTKQAHKAECDINQILARFKRTGVMEFTNKHQAQYGDVTGHDYQEAMLIVASAQSMFAELPAHVRDRFENDPAQFLEFVQDDANRDEAAELGLLKPQDERKNGVDAGTTPPVDNSTTSSVASPAGEKPAEKPKT